ncbi:MAG TPA: TlpA disulfide reductase family protein [Blastocatellia bacterium]|nr:TlpA disulfide reductase family protein [Blastocatellia bacterium]
MAHPRPQSERQSAGADAKLLAAYSRKWEAMLKRPDFEAQALVVRSEIEKLLAVDKGERVLTIAARGYELLADDEAVTKIHDRVLADFPRSDWARDIQARRAFAEVDDRKRADLLEAFIARYPEDTRASIIYSELFRARAIQADVPAHHIAALGDAWIRHAAPSAYTMVTARVKVAMVLAERKVDLQHAEEVASEAAKVAANLTVDSPLVAGEPPAARPSLIARLKEDAQVARGFVALRQGQISEAAAELSGPLAPVKRQVERDGYVLWQDADLRQLGLRPRVQWLAELFEAQGDYEGAAAYLLAGAGDKEESNRAIRSRLLAVYAKLGRSEAQAVADLKRAAQRYRDLTAPTTAARDEERRRLLASRRDAPAPDFKALRLDRKEIRLADFKGRVAVLVFWATWCGPCVAELPRLEEAFKKYAANPDVAFLAISVDEQRLAVRPFVERNGYRVPFAYDVDGAAAFAVNGVPSLVIIDRGGRVAFREEGFGSEADRYVERLGWRVDELLKETARTTNE